MENFYLISCPNCDSLIYIQKTELNCKIFFCGIDKITYKQCSPHTKKEEGERLFRENKIYGCGKQFYFDGVNIEKCENK